MVTSDLVEWPVVAAEGFAFPVGVPVSELADELTEMLASADPRVRDDYAYSAAARWILAGHFDDMLEDLGGTAAERFDHPEIQARTFAPLLLDCVLTRGRAAAGTVAPVAAQRWYTRFAAWYPAEADTWGWDDRLGWLHAVAHGADAAAAFAAALPDRRVDVLDLCARRMTAPTEHRYVQMEDARLARALTRILLAADLTVDQASGWLRIVWDALEGGGPGATPAWAFNTFATLQSLHLHLTRGLADGGTPPHAQPVADQVTAILRLPYRWLA